MIMQDLLRKHSSHVAVIWPRFEEDGQVSEEPSRWQWERQGPCNNNGLINLPTGAENETNKSMFMELFSILRS